ncbi:MAG: carboxypeptidase-like regulatory domain-containing protein [Kofleriaceae bacterium]
MGTVLADLRKYMKFLWLALLISSACTNADGSGGDDGGTQDAVCSTGMRWTGGNSESPLMHPGADCIGCHTTMREGPRFIAAGTVFDALDEPTDCYGVPGVTVTLTDANGMSVSTTTNSAGNFFFKPQTNLVAPLHAKLAFEGRERAMVAGQSTGACATCHTDVPDETLPGRILAP